MNDWKSRAARFELCLGFSYGSTAQIRVGCAVILSSNRFHEKIRRQALVDLRKHPKAGCRPPRVFDDEQRADGGEDFHGFD